MTDSELDRYLAGEAPIVPSSGFAPNVMDAVRREAATPPPIPFPWKRAIPALLSALLIAIGFAAILLTPGTAISTPQFPRAAPFIAEARAIGSGWILLALLLSFLSIKLAKVAARA